MTVVICDTDILQQALSHGRDRKTFEVMTSLLAATLYQGNPDMNHKFLNIGSTERYILHMKGMSLHILVNGKFAMGKLKSSLLS